MVIVGGNIALISERPRGSGHAKGSSPITQQTPAMSPQNIYDDNEFFKNYMSLPRSQLGLEGAPEWPELRALLPLLRGTRVLDLGCGLGWVARYCIEQGSEHVLGIDLSENMLEGARRTTDSDKVDYRRGDLEELQLPAGEFDVVFSGLALHYVSQAKFDGMLRELRRCLKSGGSFVFSVEHPICTAPTDRSPYFAEINGRSIWPLHSYLEEGERKTDWLAEGVVKTHRTVATYLNGLVDAGFAVQRMIEWSPSKEQIVEHPDWAKERDRPYFLLVKAVAV